MKIRYKQTALGVAWAILQPVLTMVVFSVFFGRLGRIPSDGLPYPVFAFSALVPWQLFAFALAESSNSVVANQRLVTKVYFPRLIMPMAAVVRRARGLLPVARSSCLSLMAYYGVPPSGALWTLPLWTLLAVVTALAVGLWLVGAERPVSRRPLHAAVSDAVLAVRHAGRLSQLARARGVALALRAQPDGRRRRGLPLGAARTARRRPR